MKKFYSIVLMACAMLVSANIWAADVTTRQQIQNAINGASAGQTVDIRLTGEEKTIDVDATITIQDGQIVNIDLNGHDLLADKPMVFVLRKGTLNITGTGTVEKKGYDSNNTDAIRVYGSTEPTDANYSNLIIGEDVEVNAHGDKNSSGKETTNAITVIEQASSPATKKAAYGVNIEIKGKVYGSKYGVKINGSITQNVFTTEYDNRPYVHVASTAEVYSAPETSNSIAIYSSGVGRILIEGYVHGATGVCVKGGVVDLNDAIVKSDYTGAYDDPKARTNKNGTAIVSGIEAGGSAIVIASQNGYPGGQEVTISGDTKVTGGSGFAIDEALLVGGTKVESVEIQGGTIEAGGKGAVVITEETAGENVVTVVGGNYEGTVGIREDNGEIVAATVENFVPKDDEGNSVQNYYTTAVTGADGKTTIAVTYFENLADKPAVSTDPNSVVAAAENSSFVWVSNADVEETLTENKELTYLEATDNEHKQVLYVGDKDHNVTFIVGRIILGPKAQIVVAAGSTLIVDGKQGIVANSVDNLVLNTKEGKPAIFLFNPAVTSNRHPSATVEFVSKSYRKSSSSLAWQRFGIPTNGVTSIVAKYNDTEVPTAFDFFNYDNNAWEVAGYIHTAGKTMDYTKMANAFEYFQMLNNTPEAGTVVTMTGNLVGNANPQLNVRGTFWNGYANSFMGRMSVMELIDMIPNTVDKAIYLYDINAVQATWEPLTLMDAEGMFIDPMQPFLIRNTKAAAEVEVGYAEAVYNPAVNPTAAPARRVASDMTRAKLVVRGEGCIDRVTVAESDMFTADFDNGYDAAKYMNDGINMYVSAAEKMSVYATDNLENTYVGVASVNGGTYTISFEKVAGENLTLIDLATGAQVAMTEGNVYEFNVAANTVNDYRFQIVGRAQVATDVETISAANNGAVYTIMGQYVGQISEWNNLPAGIYVVDGVKRVK